MRYLLVQQIGLQGEQKTWRLSPLNTVYSFGSSKQADLRSFSSQVQGIQGFFEFRQNEWVYVSLGTQDDKIFSLEKKTEIKTAQMHLLLQPYEASEALFSKISTADFSQKTAGKEIHQIFSVYFGSQLLETAILQSGESFVSRFFETPIAFQSSEDWTVQVRGPLEVRQRTIYLENNEALARFSINQVYDPSSKKILQFVAAVAVVLLVMFLSVPQSQDAAEMATQYLPPKVQEAHFIQPKKREVPVEQKGTSTATAATAAPSSGFKSLNRLSSLIGKISNSAQKSANILTVTEGRPPGPQTAAVNLGSTGKNWHQEGQAQNSGVKTIGSGGGRGLAALGKMMGGKAGQGGAELIEEDAEVVGGLDREVIAGVIKSYLGQVLYCYERQLSASPDLFGKVAVKFTINAAGKVELEKIADTSLRSEAVESCILNRVSQWKFPNPAGGTKVVVTYPFLFKSNN